MKFSVLCSRIAIEAKTQMETICIVCPNGCRLTVKSTSKGLVVTGNKCSKGEKYGRDEASDPRRVVTCVARTSSSHYPCIPVKTEKAVPKKMIPHLLKAVYRLELNLPLKRGQRVIKNFEDSGIDVVLTRSIPPDLRKART